MGPIPTDWEVRSLVEVLNKGRLGGNYPNQLSETDYPLIKMGNIARGYIDTKKVEYIRRGVIPEQQHRLARGDLLFNTRNTLDLVGKVAIWRDELPLAYYNSNLMRLEFDRQQVCSNEYANAALNAYRAVNTLRGLATGTTSVAAIYTRDLLGMPFLVPPLTEQRAIAKALSDVDALLGALDRLIAKKRDLRQAAMQQLLTGQTRLPGFHRKWEARPLNTVIDELEAGVSVNSVEGDLNSDPERPAVLKTSSIAGGVFIPSECKPIAARDLGRAKLSPAAETVIISRMNTIELVGECGYVPADFPRLFVPDRLWMTRFKPGVEVSAKWLAFILSTGRSRQLLRNIATGTSGSMKNISKGAFLGLQFEFPMLDEQIAIASVLTDLDAELAALEQRRDKTRALKQSMMQELLTGRTRLVAPEPAHA